MTSEAPRPVPADALPFECPACGQRLAARLSWAMQGGLNSGHGTCTRCNTFLHLEVAPEGGRMIAQRWSEYHWQQVKELPDTHWERAMWRADRLSDRVDAGQVTIFHAVRYALHQGQHRERFLARLTFMEGAGAAMREHAVYQRDQGRRQPDHAAHFEARAALLEGLASSCMPAEEAQHGA